MDDIQELRGHVSALREATSVNQGDVLLLQEDLRALQSGQSSPQSGVDVPSMDHLQEL